MAVLVFLVLIAVGGIVWLKYQGGRAMNMIYTDVRHLTLNEIVDVGTRASGSFLQRAVTAGGRLDRTLGRVPVRATDAGDAEWEITSRGGVMAITVTKLPEEPGYRVGGAASAMRIAQRSTSFGGIWGMSTAMTNAIFAALGVPHNPGRLIRQRKRVLQAVETADRTRRSSTDLSR